jgi:hypothetical protein
LEVEDPETEKRSRTGRTSVGDALPETYKSNSQTYKRERERD